MMRKGKLNPEVRKKIIIRIGDLIEWNCKACEYNQPNMNISQIQHCRQHCVIGQELARLGRMLEEKERGGIEMAEITKEAYEAMKKEGKPDKFIANYFGVTQAALSYHKKKWKEEMKKEEKQNSEETRVNEMEELKQQLKQLLAEQEETITNLKEENTRLKEELQALKVSKMCSEFDGAYTQWKKEKERLEKSLESYKNLLRESEEVIKELRQEIRRKTEKMAKLERLLQVAIEL